jgi:NAD(P)-dependent dehydrogenase (short-subunit alcohol dehydrogenase family)
MATKIALVTGGSRGLGKDMAISLAEKGIDVILTYKGNKDMAEAVVKEIEAIGRKAVTLQFDAENIKGYDGFYNTVKDALQDKWATDRFDFLVNNAGIGGSVPIANVTEELFDTFMNIHFKGVYFLSQKAFPLLNDNGAIINISTGTTRFSVPGYSVYSSLKSAVETFTKYLAKELGSRGIRANVVAPGPVATDFNNGKTRDDAQQNAFLSSLTALGRVGESEDIGPIVAFLCTDEAKWINGQRIEVSGGINL